MAAAWAASPLRPRVAPAVAGAWTQLLDDWVADPSLPLFIRKASNNRGSVIEHQTGRALVPTDNSPAHWTLGLALSGRTPTLAEVREALAHDTIPVALVIKRAERETARYRCMRSEISLNDLGWKVGHLDDVGLGRVKLQTGPMDKLISHFRRFLWPGNMFVMPLQWGGLAEMPEVVEALRGSDA